MKNKTGYLIGILISFVVLIIFDRISSHGLIVINQKGQKTLADGSTYSGEFRNGLINGKGVLVTPKGDIYNGEFKNNFIDGQGILRMADGSEYSGFFKDNKPYGKGQLKRSDGSIWEGFFNGWSSTGQYTLFSNGSICSGYFLHGLLNGQGKCSYSNGMIYEGEFKKNQFEGEGVMTFKEGLAQHGQVFKGQWKGFKFLGTDEAISEEKHLKGITSLEQRVDEILKMDKVNMRLYIDDVFTLADQYIAEKRLVDADRLLHVALEVDNWRLNYQLKHAQILLALGRRNEAIEKAKRIFTFAENPILIQGAQMLLEKAGEPIKAVPVTIPACTGMTIVLVPMGNVNMQLLKEVIPKLEKIMGIKFVISSQVINEGSLPSGDQLDAEKLVYILAQNFKTSNYPNFTGFLGVTEHDLNTSYTRFVFGTAGNGYGVFSYNRYTAKFNQTKENRVLLVERTVKQAVSSAFLLLDIPRGTNPMSIRSYAHNLFEHDSKPMVVDDWSMGKLDELKSKYCHK